MRILVLLVVAMMLFGGVVACSGSPDNGQDSGCGSCSNCSCETSDDSGEDSATNEGNVGT